MRKYHSKLLSLLLPLSLLIALTACGGGGGGGEATPTPQAQKVTVTIGLQGNSAVTVGSVDLDVVLPDGFVLETDNVAQPPASALTLLIDNATTATNYTPETSASNGGIRAAIIKTDGFAGNAGLMQLSRIYTAGATLPKTDDFMVTVIASDLNGAPLTGITAQVNITAQPAP